jgi:hypothetical protein
MSPKSFPAAIAMIAFLALSLPLASAFAEPPGTRPRNHPAPSVHVQVNFWRWVLDLLDPAVGHGGRTTISTIAAIAAIADDAGCEMDPDGRLRTVSAPAPGADRH